MGVHSFDKLGAKMGVHSFFWQRVRAVRHTKNMGAINGLMFSYLGLVFPVPILWREKSDVANGMENKAYFWPRLLRKS